MMYSFLADHVEAELEDNAPGEELRNVNVFFFFLSFCYICAVPWLLSTFLYMPSHE